MTRLHSQAIAQMELLETNRHIREKVRWLLDDRRDERIILVAFVGSDAIEFLKEPRGIKLYCWLKVPGTNPNGLRDLLNNDVDLFAVSNLHTKLYWSQRRGAILGSANLTKNAFGEGNLHELALSSTQHN